MLTCGIAAALSKHISYGSVYTTKLLRRGIDIERPKTTNALQTLTVADAMAPVPRSAATAPLDGAQDLESDRAGVSNEQWERLAGTVTDTRRPQELFRDETLEQALRQLTLYGPSGLPVLSDDREHLQGWITRNNILDVLTETAKSSEQSIERGALAADLGADDPSLLAHQSSTPLTGYQIVEITVGANSPALGRRVEEITWPPGCLLVAVTEPDAPVTSSNDTTLREGKRVLLLAPVGPPPLPQDPTSAPTR
jgi:CIC family chloride channel protein